MSYWSHNPELYDEIITEALPEPWKTRVLEDEIELTEVPEDILYEAAGQAESDYWAGRADEAKDRYEEMLMRKAEEQEKDGT